MFLELLQEDLYPRSASFASTSAGPGSYFAINILNRFTARESIEYLAEGNAFAYANDAKPLLHPLVREFFFSLGSLIVHLKTFYT